MEKVTIVIPVYNAEKTISKCIDSILNQTNENYQVLLIDDGSKDNSLKVIKEYEKNYPKKIKVISKENEGVVATRNLGIDLCKTKYIMFIDNDDYIDKDYVEQFLSAITKRKDKVVLGGYRRTTEDRIIHEESAKDDLWTKYRIITPWARIYDADFLKQENIKYKPISIGEDIYFNMSIYAKTNQISSIDYIGYNWFYNTESVSNTTQKGLNKKVNPIELLTEVKKINEKKADDPIINYFYYRYMVWYLLFSGKKATAKEFIKEYEKLSTWLTENNIKLRLPFTSKKIKSEPIKNRLSISIFHLIEKLHLMKLFAKVYCRGDKNV